MDFLYIIAARAAPAIAGAVTALGIASEHSEVIAIGLATAVAAGLELVVRLYKQKGKK